MALLPRVPHYYDNAIAEAYLEYALKGRDPQLILQSARMVDCLRSFCRSCTQEQFNALALMPGATAYLPPKAGARKRHLTRPALQPSLRPLAKAKPRLPLVSPLACAPWPGSQQLSCPSIREQANCGSSQRPSEILPGSEHWEYRLSRQGQSISLNTSLTLSIPNGEGSRVRHPGPPTLYFRGRPDATIIVKHLENSFQTADKIIRAPLFEEIWGMNTLSKPERARGDEHLSVKSRLRRLYATYQEIGRIKQHYALGLRILILMMRHEKEVLMSEFSGRLRKGQRLDSYANEQIAQEWNIEEVKVSYKFMQAKRYLALIRRGPGCLLYVKSSTWETKLKDEQVDGLCEYLEKVREYLVLEGSEGSGKPSKATLEKQNFRTAKLIIESLLHFGWTHEKLAKSGTNLMKALSGYVDLLALEQGRICDKTGRDFQGEQDYEVEGEDDGIHGDDGGYGEVERHDSAQDPTPRTLNGHADLSQASKRRRIDNDPPSDRDCGRLDQQKKTSPQLYHPSAGLQGTDADGQAVQHEQDTGQPSLQSTDHSNISRHLDDTGNRDLYGMYSLDTMPSTGLGSVDSTSSWSKMLNLDLGMADPTSSWDEIVGLNLEMISGTYSWEDTSDRII